ncbi:bifunctional UDP-N-acetylmuramoyl-tripeptide:D-alanyl-D-alanine ligase/alanine racemase [Prolixibacteraceae bacterium JC049]|nr:bifunctional UDP-N-acetylmuramoyl-tripeptide:D-alanyl-D-alanine ligase/alanine racemase [Prolixibacteraceae bacterium JC049]
MKYTPHQIVEILKPIQVMGQNQLGSISELSIDSRNILHGNGVLFFAISGKNNDGHNYLSQAYEKGVRFFVVEKISNDYSQFKDALFFEVKNSIKALQKLAAYHRSTFDIPVIGITGSNGKTVTKEWLFSILNNRLKTTRSPKSYNSQVGVPLSVALLNENSELGIFEAGISKPDEMHRLAPIIQPTIGIFTTLSSAHQKNFINREQKLQEKLNLFSNCSVVIYNSNDNGFEPDIESRFTNTTTQLFNWGYNNDNTKLNLKAEKQPIGTKISGSWNNKAFELIFPFSDKASLQNIGNTIAAIIVLGYHPSEFADSFPKLEAIAMRMEIKEGINGCTIINDSYNSDVHSLQIALNLLNAQAQKNNQAKTVILSDIQESGISPQVLYSNVNALLEQAKIDRLIGIGNQIAAHKECFNVSATFYQNTDNFLEHLHKNRFSNQLILIKGARQFHFDQISTVLQEKKHQTVMEVDLTAMVYNLNQFRKQLDPSTEIMVMVKAFSYGSGSTEIASLLQYHRVSALAVAIADEGVELRKAGITIPIVVMNPEEHSFDLMIEYNLEANIYSIEQLKKYAHVIHRNAAKQIPIHLKLDTGMHRLGVDNKTELNEIIAFILSTDHFFLRSVFSHLVSSDEPWQDDFTLLQIQRFEQMADIVTKSFSHPIKRHILNSAGIERFKQFQFEMVRLGIGLYGVSSGKKLRLRNVSSLITTISQIRDVAEGETIGYGRKGMASRKMRIAVLPIGYADGFNRKLSNGIGKVFINGKFAPVIGNICMDMCMIDITDIKANEGDEVEIFGKHISLQEIADLLETIPYEILTTISRRVKRIYIQE